MVDIVYFAIAVATLAFALVSRRVTSSLLTAPLVFLAFGAMLSVSGLFESDEHAHEALHLVAEITLVLVLFTDAAQVDLSRLRQDHSWPLRMLVVGLPVAIGLGTLIAPVLLPGWPIWEAALLAAILAPTDAALGQAVVTNPAVPERVRRALTVESGLNDGLALPAVILFACMASATHSLGGTLDWVAFGLKQVVLGPLAGLLVGVPGAIALKHAADKGWSDRALEGVAVVALAALCYLLADMIGGNGFIAAFVGGLCFGNLLQKRCSFAFEFAESEGQALILVAFLMVGMILLPEALSVSGWISIVIAIASLFIVRPVAIWVAMIGSGAAPMTRLFLGWFGPRGLASALFALLVLSKVATPHASEVLMIVILTVALSALLHGITAVPGAQWYGRWVKRTNAPGEVQPMAAPAAKPLKDAGTKLLKPSLLTGTSGERGQE